MLRSVLGPLGTALVLALATGVASSRAGAGAAGTGAGAVSGYQVSDVHFGDAPSDPSRITHVDFRLDPAPSGASRVSVRLRADGPWHPCRTRPGAPDARCATPGESLATVEQIAVLAD